MIKQVNMYAITCDGCGKTFSADDIVAWVDVCTAREQALDSEWQEIDGKHYCPDCYEYSEELDEYVPKSKETLEQLKKRMLDEHHELEDRLTKLNAALLKDGFREKVGDYQYFMMKRQVLAMEMYYKILAARLNDLFGKNKNNEE